MIDGATVVEGQGKSRSEAIESLREQMGIPADSPFFKSIVEGLDKAEANEIERELNYRPFKEGKLETFVDGFNAALRKYDAAMRGQLARDVEKRDPSIYNLLNSLFRDYKDVTTADGFAHQQSHLAALAINNIHQAVCLKPGEFTQEGMKTRIYSGIQSEPVIGQLAALLSDGKYVLQLVPRDTLPVEEATPL